MRIAARQSGSTLHPSWVRRAPRWRRCDDVGLPNVRDVVTDRRPNLATNLIPAHAERQVLADAASVLDVHAVEQLQQAACAGALHDVLRGVHFETPVLQWRRHRRSSLKAQPANNFCKKNLGAGWRLYRHLKLIFGGWGV